MVGDLPIPRSRDTYGELIRRLKQLGIARITFDRGVPPEELALLVETLSHPERSVGQASPGAAIPDALEALGRLQRVRVGRFRSTSAWRRRRPTSRPSGGSTSGASVAEAALGCAQNEGTPDPSRPRA